MQHSRAPLRQAVLAVSVLDDVAVSIDIGAGDRPGDPAVLVTGEEGRSTRLTWSDIEVAVGRWSHEPGHEVPRGRLRTVMAAALLAAAGSAHLAAAARIRVEPEASGLHDGPTWARMRLGRGVCAGWALAPDALTAPLPLIPVPSLVPYLPGEADWALALRTTERLADVLVERLRRDLAEQRPLVLRPVADVDVCTMLVAPRLRAWLAGIDGDGLATLSVPDRSRGWTDLRRIDPAFVTAAWAATEPLQRGFARPLLVSAEEVALPHAPGHVAVEGLVG